MKINGSKGIYGWLGAFVIVTMTHMKSTDASVQCLTCSYIFAGEDGSMGLQCVTDVHNFPQTSTANCTSGVCSIRAVYTREYTRLLSMVRGCATQQDMSSCDHPSVIRPTCTAVCDQYRCNGQNGDLWSTNSNNNNNNNGSGAMLVSGKIILLFSMMLGLVHILLVPLF